ncbi:protein kinase family protein [Parabacteroides sp. ZJ-118]|uniref:protein kinase family protein n=1 Tax=Parabacteroides sp. ZJ-118 TaxID=2709398 RepID=UPI0013EAED89|nr:protein kinase family protein [Parabacteroides sp. ZJ-118]
MDKHVKNGIFRRDARGRLIAYTGGFSVVFPYEAANKEKWAFRCWHSDVNNSKRRYEIISEAIQKTRLDFLCDFEYIEKGINVEGKVYPTTRMRWIDGITIKDYICRNRNSKQLLVALADKFLKMTRDLHNLSLAHGDLQHGNILISNNLQLYLVDYDSFYCPELKGEADNVTGLPDYQHPSRSTNKFVSEKLDYFSELIIYLSILAIAENPSLIDKYKVEDADRLLFCKEDYSDIKNAQIYKDIYSLGNDYQDMLAVLEEYLMHNRIDDLLPFEGLLLHRKISFFASATKVVRNTQQIKIEWNVPFDTEVLLCKGGDKDAKKCERKGSLSTTLTQNTTFELSIKMPDGQVIKKEIAIKVFDECKLEFTADKYYVFPTIPVKLSWKVENAKRVWLDDEEMSPFGTRVIEPKRMTTCVLSAEDEFGKKEKRIEIGMLPIPQIKTLLVPTPNIVNNLSITIKQPRYYANVSFPDVAIGMVDTEIPKVPSLKDIGLNIELSPPFPRFNLKRSIKNVFNHITKK